MRDPVAADVRVHARPSSFGGTNTNLNTQVRDLARQVGSGNAYLARSRGTYGLAYNTYERTGLTAGAAAPRPPPIAYPNNSTLSQRLKTAAPLLSANLGTRVITIHWGGFDTHTGQLAAQDRQMAEFSRALAAFRADLVQRGIEQRVATLAFSEFGRRVRENGTGAEAGTDHGAGGLMFAMGSGVRGGFASDWPGCELNESRPDQQRRAGQPEGADGLPLRVQGGARRVARRGELAVAARRSLDRDAGPW